MSLIRKGAKLESAFQANPFPRPCTPISAKGTCRRVPRGAWSKRYTPAEPLAPLARVERGCAGRWSNRQIVAPNGNPSAFSNTQPARIKPVTFSAEGEVLHRWMRFGWIIPFAGFNFPQFNQHTIQQSKSNPYFNRTTGRNNPMRQFHLTH